MLGTKARPAIRAPHYVRATTRESLCGYIAVGAAPTLRMYAALAVGALNAAVTPRRKGAST